MSRAEERLGEMEATLPNLPTPIANYVPAKRAGNLVFTASQVSAVEGRAYKGKLGATLSIEDGRAATRACVINCLAALKSVIGSKVQVGLPFAIARCSHTSLSPITFSNV
jgi:enamine deaminase RidA (YjgF/YER057c/UK114 family)